MTVVLHQNLKKTLWKNGLGFTTELAVSPPGATLLDFDWRVSFAEMNEDSEFSKFEGYERVLSIVEGRGLFINNNKLEPFVPHYFSGETTVRARLVDGPIVDVGAIWKRGRFQVKLSRLNERDFSDPQINEKLSAGSPTSVRLLFLISGSLQVSVGREPTTLTPRDAVYWKGPSTRLIIYGATRPSVALIEIERV